MFPVSREEFGQVRPRVVALLAWRVPDWHEEPDRRPDSLAIARRLKGLADLVAKQGILAFCDRRL